MSSTGRLQLPYIVTAQAQKEVTHNDGLNRLDAFVTPVVADIASAPPGSPTEGDLYIVGASATGDFAGEEDNLAQYLTGGWVFYTPFKWMDAFVEASDSRYAYDGSGWVPFGLIMKDTGEYLRVGHQQEDVTVDSGAFKDTTITIPNRSILLTVNVRVLTAVTGATSFDVGIAGETSKFGGSIGIGQDSTNIGIIGPTAFYSDTAVRLTANGSNFTGGVIRTTMQYLQPRGPWNW
ncbi:MAG: ribonuclease III [Rickettsiales bacterium]|nr:ribonuclease III [Rickettsiales bacterium]MCH2547297.1 DUF2793 domain-containing protein [Alphaproteobacteria bacterium]|tara:strand:- start:921 stop:1625 length:705 start_codon:yes stop_codon:yes gene_type:complete